MSQLDLALASGVSSRHISFLETGRSAPSREMVQTLAATLDVPLRQQNALLAAAGFAARYSETSLLDPQMADMLRALKLILRQHGPLGGAVAFDREWDVVMANTSYVRMVERMLGERAPRLEALTVTQPPRPNVLRMLFDSAGWRPHIRNWEAVARSFVARVRQEAAWSGEERGESRLQALLAQAGVPAPWREPGFDGVPSLVTPIELDLGRRTARLFGTTTTLGTPLDITLQELRIESFHAADEESERAIREVLGQS
jgi:transcriptional regulator with XRE-family HTH domain